MFAPLAVNVVDIPVQLGIAGLLTVTIGIVLTVTVVVAEEGHPFVVPRTVEVVVIVGDGVIAAVIAKVFHV